MIRMISFTDFTAARTRRTCRVQYQDLLDALDDGDAALFTTEPPADRAAHLSAMADVVDAMSCLYASAHTGDPLAARTGGRWTMPLTLASGVTLYRLAAAAEQDLADAEWTDAADIHPYEWLWFARKFVQVTAKKTADYEIDLTVRCGDGELVELPYVSGEMIRTGGPSTLAVTELARLDGADAGEIRQWEDLAVTCNRERRAALLTALAGAVAGRHGGQAAQALLELADTERSLTCTDTGQLDQDRYDSWSASLLTFPPPRPFITFVFFMIAAAVVLPRPVLASLPLALAGAAITGWGALMCMKRQAARRTHPRPPGRVVEQGTALTVQHAGHGGER